MSSSERSSMRSSTSTSTVACSTEPTGGEFQTYSALVVGRVTDAADRPVTGVRLSAEVAAGDCTAWERSAGAPGVTVADGSYRMQVLSTSSSPVACVRVTASDAGRASEPSVVRDLRFEPTATSSLPYDSARVDLRLP